MIRSEKGLAMIELLIAIAIGSALAAGAALTTGQLVQVTRDSGNDSMAVREAQNLGFRVSQDLLMAMKVTLTDDLLTPDHEFVIIEWKDWQTGAMCQARYYWADPASPLKRASRRYLAYDIDGALTDNTTALVADSIYAANLSLEANGMWKLNVEARSGNESATREYRVIDRVD